MAVRVELRREARRRPRPGFGEAAALVSLSGSPLDAYSDRGFKPSDRLCCETITLRESEIATSRTRPRAIRE